MSFNLTKGTLHITSKDPWDAATAYPVNQDEWVVIIHQIVQAMATAHRLHGSYNYATKFHFPAGRIQWAGLGTWVAQSMAHYDWAKAFARTLTTRLKRRGSVHPTSVVQTYLCSYPANMYKRESHMTPVRFKEGPFLLTSTSSRRRL